MSSKELVMVGARITKTLQGAVLKHIEKGTHVSFSEFLRSAMREKIEREAPYLLKIKEGVEN